MDHVVFLVDTIAKEEWWFLAYTVERCPGLPDWRALLKPGCAAAFATPDSTPRGYYLAGPADWGGHDAGRIANRQKNP